jgi:hypothetical protein
MQHCGKAPQPEDEVVEEDEEEGEAEEAARDATPKAVARPCWTAEGLR